MIVQITLSDGWRMDIQSIKIDNNRFFPNRLRALILIRFGTTEQGRDDKFMKLDMHDNEN